MRVLIVGTDIEALSDFEDALKRRGHEVVGTAHDDAAAIALVRHHTPQLVLVLSSVAQTEATLALVQQLSVFGVPSLLLCPTARVSGRYARGAADPSGDDGKLAEAPERRVSKHKPRDDGSGPH